MIVKIEAISKIKIKLQERMLTEHACENVELKRDWSKEHGEKISMLCNGQPENDCFLVVGVEDDGTLAGHDDSWLSSKLEVLSQHCNQYLDPSITLLDITTEDVDGSKVIICKVKSPGVVVKWRGNAFSGNGTTKKKLDQQEILELNLSLPGITDLSKKIVDYSPLESLVKAFSDILAEKYSKVILEKYRLHNTKCGKILFGETKYRVVKYDDCGDVLSNETRLGLFGLLSASTYDEVRTYYSQHLSNSARISDSLLREAIGNCVGHAAYKDNDGEIILELHPSRLIVSNLAFTEYTSLANKWFSSAHKSPNPFLMEVLRIAKKVDELGRGKKKLLSECLSNGFNAPVVSISEAGRYKRWMLQVTFEESDDRFMSIQQSLSKQYSGQLEKTLIAYALVLWHQKPFSEIKQYFDNYESKIAAEIISDIKGPVFFWEERDKIVLHRWVKILIEEGKSSKEFTQYEENEIYKKCQTLHNQYHGGLITPAEFRELAHLSNSGSDKSLTSRILSKWLKEGKVTKEKRGTYKFTDRSIIEIEKSELLKLIKAFSNKGEDNA
jgi:predicted HTH transcriptional regulator